MRLARLAAFLERRGWDLMVAGLVVAGAALMIVQYAGDRALWLDELALVNNVLDRGLVALLSDPLDYYQVSPPGFIAGLWGVSRVAGGSEHAFRLVPLLAGLASLGLLWAIGRRMLRGYAQFFVLAAFALSPGVIWYSSSVKHYPFDVAGGLLVIWLSLRWCERPGCDRLAALAVAGVLAPWFGFGAMVVVAGSGLALTLKVLLGSDRGEWSSIVILGFAWSVNAVAMASWNLHFVIPENRGYLTMFWKINDAFPKFPPASIDDLLWPGRWLLRVLSRSGLPSAWAVICSVLVPVGVVSLWSRRRTAALLVALPPLVAMALAAGRVYPSSFRTMLFALPLYLLAAGEGAERLRQLAMRRSQLAAGAVALAAVTGPFVAIWHDPPVYRLEDAKPVFRYLAEHRRSGDAMYVYFGAWQTAYYYLPRFGLDDLDVTFGDCYADPRRLLRELDLFRGRSRVWVLVVHPRNYEWQAIDSYLDTIGIATDRARSPAGLSVTEVELRLYDLSNQRRLTRSAAKSHPLPPLPPWLGRACVGPGVPPRNLVGGHGRERLSTHGLPDVERLCPRMLLIDQGRMVYDGALAAIRRSLVTERVLRVDFEGLAPRDLPPGVVEEDRGPERLVPRSTASRSAAGA